MAPEAVTSHHHQGEQGALVENAASSTITSSDHEGLPGQGETEIDLEMTLKQLFSLRIIQESTSICR